MKFISNLIRWVLRNIFETIGILFVGLVLLICGLIYSLEIRDQETYSIYMKYHPDKNYSYREFQLLQERGLLPEQHTK